VSATASNGRVANDRPGDKLGGEPVVELRFRLVFKLSDVVAAEDRASGAWSEQEDGGVRMED
jgi:hypothetical protein